MRIAQLAIAALVLLAAVGPASAAPIIPDPVNDRLASNPTGPDVIGISVDWAEVPGFMFFQVIFNAPISPPSLFLPNSVAGLIDVDTDANAATGVPGGFSSLFAGIPPFALGAERTIDLFSEIFHPGFVDVLNSTTLTAVGTVPITYSGNTLTFSVPLSTLGGTTLSMTAAGAFGDLLAPSDRVPNGAQPLVATPEPASLATLGAVVLAAGLVRRRFRSPQAAVA